MKILVADDDDAIQICMEEIARQEGWNLITARDGEECLRLIRSQNPKLIVLDLRMPKLTGEEVLEELGKEDNVTPVILISAEKSIMTYRKYPSVVQIMNKPFDLSQFIDAVNTHLQAI